MSPVGTASRMFTLSLPSSYEIGRRLQVHWQGRPSPVHWVLEIMGEAADE